MSKVLNDDSMNYGRPWFRPVKAKAMEIPTMGNQPIILGGLYSAISDEFLPGAALWNSEDVKSHMFTINHPKQETKWSGSLTDEQKIAMLNVGGSAEISIDIEIGLLKGTGSFSFLTEYKV